MERFETAGPVLGATVVDWDHAELLPRERCAVCGETSVPWGIRFGRFLCSKRCGDGQAWTGGPAGAVGSVPHTH